MENICRVYCYEWATQVTATNKRSFSGIACYYGDCYYGDCYYGDCYYGDYDEFLVSCSTD